MRALLVGGTGFIGSHTVDACLAKGIEVRCLALQRESYRNPLDSVDYRIADVGDLPALRDAMHGCEVMVYLAHASTPGTSMRDLRADLERNTFPFLGALEVARETGARVVYLSSGGTVYGDPDEFPVTESSRLRPRSAYGVTKATNEHYLELHHFVYGLSFAILRPSNAYGPRVDLRRDQGIIPIFMRKMLLDEPIDVWGDGEAVRDFVYVEDVARAIVAACVRSDASGVFNIGSGEPHTVNDILRLTCAAVRPELVPYPRVRYTEGRRFDVARVVLDISAAQQALGWSPQVRLAEGIARTAAWLRELGASGH